MLAVIADDITGAAEIAGIAYRYGLSCELVIANNPSNAELNLEIGTTSMLNGVIVIATDTRSLPAEEAYAQTASITRQLCALAHSGNTTIFHKTDSALRGNVQDELQAIIDNSPYTNAIFMPANPSKGRIIKDSIYYIRTAADTIAGHLGTPLAETDFRFDPEFPALTSNVKERFPDLTIPDATSQADIDAIVEKEIKNYPLHDGQGDANFLAGAADLFTSLICHIFHHATSRLETFGGLPKDSSKLIVRGSTQSKAIDLGIPVEVMPLDVFYEKSAPYTWAASILARMNACTNTSLPGQDTRGRSSILTIGDKEVRLGKHAAVYLRNSMAEVTCTILKAHTPDELIIEGGATAYAILSQTPWRSFLITDEIAPGVVRMQPAPNTQHPVFNTHLHITLKPGSYDWGKLFSNE